MKHHTPEQLRARLNAIKDGTYRNAQPPKSEVDCAKFVEAFRIACLLADRESDGHFTLMRFTTGWGATFKTPNGRDDIASAGLLTSPTEAIEVAISKAIGIGGGA